MGSGHIQLYRRTAERQKISPGLKKSKMFNLDTGEKLPLYFCEKCQIKLPGASKYEDHMNAHEGRKYHCGFCGKAFKSKERLIYHEKEHRGIFKYRCPVCQKGYNHHGDFRKHQKSAMCTIVQHK